MVALCENTRRSLIKKAKLSKAKQFAERKLKDTHLKDWRRQVRAI